MSSLLDSMRHRGSLLAAAASVTLAYVLFGGLSPAWALSCLAALSIWSALWPFSRVDAGGPDTAKNCVQEASNSGSGLDQFLPPALLDGVPDAALLLDARSLVITTNKAAQAISPISTGNPLSQWTRAPDLLAAAERAARTSNQQRCHVRLFTPVERSLDVLITPIAIARKSRQPVLLVVLRDLTEQEQLSRMRADFVANASHELRTPLASLRGFVETLQGAAKDDPAAQRRFLGIMQAQAERMSRLIEDLLSLSRIEMREHVAPTASVDLAAVVHDVAAALRPMAKEAEIELRLEAFAGPMQVIGDRDELVQVAQNLIQNAIKYGRSGGNVAVAIKREDARLLLEIADNGIGVAPEHVPRLTERFYRVSAKDSKDLGGTGLGLAIVKHIVNRHRGELRISSTLGQGSTFGVALPAAPFTI